MTLLRSLAFNCLFYLNLTVQLLLFAPVFFVVSEEQDWRIVKNWARSSLWLLRRVAGTRSEVTGVENLPRSSAIIAAKHQSYWDVLALVAVVERPTFILKKELMRVPVFGAYARRMKMIPVDRAKRGGAIASMVAGAEAAIADGRQIIIFPEGTRTLPGVEQDYRQGVFRLYEALDLPVVPVALNSGLYWLRTSPRRLPGTIHADILEPIPSGLPRQEFLPALRTAIETRSGELAAEAVARDGLPPLASAGSAGLPEAAGATRDRRSARG
ncbi:lysophospholipid acyltransferase family protein [Jiella sp. M17.18]|uniref:lysophospholipid acyltransferase family protein n=1 Tax=Jiella sp. M17.18 TaxID=3234247 RepID=UPI0034E02FD5